MVRRITNRHITPELILNAYYQGLVPMANEIGEIGFYAYEPRGILPLEDEFVVRRSLRQVIKKGDYRVTFDTAPLQVLEACSRHDAVPAYELWLSDELIDQYMKIFEMGVMHSVEVWKKVGDEEEMLAGGLYGLAFGGAFCGESMFSRAPYGSQIALVHLVEHLRARGFELLDAQMSSEHLKQFGLFECSEVEYLERFYKAAAKDISF
jgi:leucyl/phenylalanyl-tRNA--protein transferase